MTEQSTGPVVATQRYRDVTGALHRAALVPGADVDLPGSLLSARYVTGPDGAVLLQKWVSEELGRLRPEAYGRLDAEIRACAALGQRFGGPRYPRELPFLVGYNVDVVEPFVLLRPYRGDPVPVRRMDMNEWREFSAGLLRALQHTAQAGVVHGDVTRNTVRWDGATVQLVEFERSQRPGERRRAGGGPARSPEQVGGWGEADPRDDVWGAGLMIHQLSLGPHSDGVPAPGPVGMLLDHVFVESAANRPSADQLLHRLNPHAAPLEGSSPDDQLAEGRTAFDQLLLHKRRGTTPPQVPVRTDTRQVPTTSGFLAGTSRTTLLLVGAIIIAIVVAVVLLVWPS